MSDDNGLRCDNWHDTVRLVLLRYLGVHRRDLRRWLLKRLEAEQFNFFVVAGGYPSGDFASFHSLCAFRLSRLKSGKTLLPRLDCFLDAENVRQRKKKNKFA